MPREPKDFSVMGVALAGMGLALAIALIMLFLHRFATTESPQKPDPVVVPRLSPLGEAEFESGDQLAAFRAEELRRLMGYGWVDQAGGVAHIPVERAMELEE